MLHSLGHVLCPLLLLVFRVVHSSTIVVDDAYPQVQYTGSWTSRAGGNRPLNYGGTITGTNVSAARAVLSFTGSSVSVYGAGAFKPIGMFNTIHSLSTRSTTAIPPIFCLRAILPPSFFAENFTLPG
ncbi:hypothetical protein C8Q79DRAFT_939500 [Trametes meyenii]|nr:hypothetical protein C8Q79DRAFT_939500 [Trametes meyenii]